MCSHYQAIKERERYVRHFGVEPLADMGKHDVWPCYPASFIRRPREADAGDEAVPEREALPGLFGLIPHWATDTNIGRQTYNARSETVAAKPSFWDAWKNAQHCIIPVDAFAFIGRRRGMKRAHALREASWKKIIEKKDHPARESLIWKNLFFGPSRRKAVKLSASAFAVDSDAAMALAQKSGCLACHALDTKMVGPA